MGDGLYEKLSDGSGTERLLLRMDGNGSVTDWSRDGRLIAYRRVSPKTGGDIWVVPTQPGDKAYALLQSPFDEDNAQFSPDGHWGCV